jgi:hypothetical protein
MQEHILHIMLVDMPGTGDGQRKHRADGGRLNHRAEGLIVVDVGPLGEAMKVPMSLVSLQGSMGVELVIEDPFARDDVGTNRMKYGIPSIVGDQSIIFFLHGTVLGRVDEGGADGGGHRKERRRRGGRQHKFVTR